MGLKPGGCARDANNLEYNLHVAEHQIAVFKCYTILHKLPLTHTHMYAHTHTHTHTHTYTHTHTRSHTQAQSLTNANSLHPILGPEPKEAWPLLASLLQHLEPTLSRLSLGEISAVLFALSRTHYPLPAPSKKALVEVGHWAACVCTCMYMCVCVYVHVCTCACVCTCVYMCVYMYVCTCVNMCVCVFTCACVYM